MAAYDYRVEYLQTDGHAYIDSLIKSGGDITLDIKFFIPQGVADCTCMVFGHDSYGIDGRTTSLAIGANRSNGTARCFLYSNNVFYDQTQWWNNDIPIVITWDGRSLKKGGETVVSYNTATFTSSYNLYLFDANSPNWWSPSTRIASGTKIYYCKIWKAGSIVRDFIPVVKDGVPCMYDTVSGNFFYNQGIGSFAAGPKIVEHISSIPIATDPFGVGVEAPEPPPHTGYDWSYETYASEIANTCSGATRGSITVTDIGQVLPWNVASGGTATFSVNDEPVVGFFQWKNSSQTQYGFWWMYPERGTAEYKWDVPWTSRAGVSTVYTKDKKIFFIDTTNRGAYTCDLDGSNMEHVIPNGTFVSPSSFGLQCNANSDGTFCVVNAETQKVDFVDEDFSVTHKTSLPGGSFTYLYRLQKMPNGNYFAYGASAQRSIYDPTFTSRLANKTSPGAYYGYSSSKATVYDDDKIYFTGCCHSSSVMSMLYGSPYTDYTSSVALVSQDRFVSRIFLPTREFVLSAKYHSSYVPSGNILYLLNAAGTTGSELWSDGMKKEITTFLVPLTNGKILRPQRYDNSTLFTPKLIDLHLSKHFSENVITNPWFRTVL